MTILRIEDNEIAIPYQHFLRSYVGFFIKSCINLCLICFHLFQILQRQATYLLIPFQEILNIYIITMCLVAILIYLFGIVLRNNSLYTRRKLIFSFLYIWIYITEPF